MSIGICNRRVLHDHAAKRCYQRYKIVLTTDLRYRIISKIQKRDGQLIEICSRNKMIWKVTVNNNSFIVVFNKVQRRIITFLPRSKRYKSKYRYANKKMAMAQYNKHRIRNDIKGR